MHNDTFGFSIRLHKHVLMCTRAPVAASIQYRVWQRPESSTWRSNLEKSKVHVIHLKGEGFQVTVTVKKKKDQSWYELKKT